MEISLEGRVSALEVQVTHLLENQPATAEEIKALEKAGVCVPLPCGHGFCCGHGSCR